GTVEGRQRRAAIADVAGAVLLVGACIQIAAQPVAAAIVTVAAGRARLRALRAGADLALVAVRSVLVQACLLLGRVHQVAVFVAAAAAVALLVARAHAVAAARPAVVVGVGVGVVGTAAVARRERGDALVRADRVAVLVRAHQLVDGARIVVLG